MTRKEAQIKIGEVELPDGWKAQVVTQKLLGHDLGRCDYHTKTIYIRTGKHFDQTLNHEIAHALTPGAGHGKLWLEAFLRLQNELR